MFGSKDLFSKSEKINEVAGILLERYVDKFLLLARANSQAVQLSSGEEVERIAYQNLLGNMLQEASQIFYLKRLYQQAKQVSQIIAYIWRWIDADGNPKQEIAKQLKTYFVQPTKENENIGGNLEKLFAANPKENNPEEDVEVKLLRNVFPDYDSNEEFLFPIFDKIELGDEFPGLGYLLNVNINSYQGNLSDTSINNPYIFVHTIPYPPRPQLGDATVTQDELEDWVENRIPNKYYADNTYIPTTST